MSTDPDRLTDAQWRRSYLAAKALEAQRIARRARLDAEPEYIETSAEYEGIAYTRGFPYEGGPIDESLDFSRFEKNPILAFDHDLGEPPIGMFTYWGWNERGDLVVRFRFGRDERSRGFERMVRDGFASGLSLGIRRRPGGRPTLIEISLVSVPLDPSALITHVNGRPITRTEQGRTDAERIASARFDFAGAATANVDDDDAPDPVPFIDPATQPCACWRDLKGRPCGCFRMGAVNKRSGPKGLRIPCSPTDTNTNERKRTMNHDSNDNNDTISKARAKRDAAMADAWKATTTDNAATRADAEDDPHSIEALRAKRDRLCANAWRER